MKYLFLSFMGFFIFVTLAIVGCSKKHNPVESPLAQLDNQSILSEPESNREIIAVYDLHIDPITQTVKLISSERISNFHFPLTSIYPDTVKIIAQGWHPSFWITLLLTHPMPGSGIDGYDPRIIVILPANAGVNCVYPIFNVRANNSIVKETDGYTKLYDKLGGSIVGNTNPFRAYFKDQPNRVWSSTGATSEAQRWYLDLNGFNGPLTFKLVVDISTNYPSPPTPVTDNAPEPVEITSSVSDGLTVKGGTAPIEVTFLDWQGYSDIKTKVEAPDLFDGAIQLFYNRPGQKPNEYVFSGTINNTKLAPAGYYDILIAAWDIPTDIHIFKETQVHVESVPPCPIDVTPPWLNNKPLEIVIAGNYAYTISSRSGALHIYDVTDPMAPFWVGWIDLEEEGIWDLDIANGYAYVTNYVMDLQIIDVDPPQDAHIVKTVDTPRYAQCVRVSNGYAFVANSHSGVIIIDIDPVQDAYIYKTIHDETLMDFASQLYVTNDYVYVINGEDLCIIDINPLDTAYIVKTMPFPNPDGYPSDICVSGDYAYVAFGDPGLHIIDINPPEAAFLVKTLTFTREAGDVCVSNGIAYVASYDTLQVVDVDPPESATVIKTLIAPINPIRGAISGNYLFVTSWASGIQIVDITTPENAYIANLIYMLSSPQDVFVDGDYAYVADNNGGLKILDIDPPSESHIISAVYFNGASDVQVKDGIAYVSDWNCGLYIINVMQPSAPYIVNYVDLPNLIEDMFIEGGYAYMANWSGGLQIIDISPPESASLVKTIQTTGGGWGVHVSNGYAYLGSNASGINIIDIDPVESAHVVKNVKRYTWDSITDIYVDNEYAYAADGNDGLWIVDINPPESAYIANVIIPPNIINHVHINGGYAYLTGTSNIDIVDIDPAISAHIVETIDLEETAYNLFVDDAYLYVANHFGGLRIFKMK